jgi:hypothetical protein
MAGFVTNRGKKWLLDQVFRNAAEPTNLYLALCTNSPVPTVDINTLGELTQIAAGNGYTSGGVQLNRNSTDFDVLTEDDTNDRALVQIKDIVWTASGGPLPASGSGARWAVLTDDNATVANREVFICWDLASDRSVSDGQTLTIQNAELRLNNA